MPLDPQHPRCPAARRGFTLLELVAVMTVICLALAIAAPSLRGFALGTASRDGAAQVLALTQYARSAAITEARTYRLNFDTRASACWLTVREGEDFVELGENLGRRFALPDGMRIEVRRAVAGPDWLDFLPTGRCDPATIILTERDGRQTQIACPSATELYRLIEEAR